MKKSKMIALASITCAVNVILLIIGAYLPMFDLSVLFIASIVTMIPLAKNSYLATFLSGIATAILTLLLTGFNFNIVLPFVCFFAFHPLVNKFFEEKKVNFILAYAIKAVWFVLTILLMYFFAEMFIVENETLRKYIILIIIVGGALGFILYDYFFRKFQRMVGQILERLKL